MLQLDFSDAIVSNNICGLDYLKSLPTINKNRIYYIPNGIEVTKYFSKQNDYRTIGCLSNFIDYKNISIIIEAFKYLKQSYGLKLGGKGPELKKYKNELIKINTNPEEILVGEVREKDLFFNDIDIFVYPSLREGSPNALLEAMSYGKFCLASNIKENIETLGADRPSEMFFDPRNPSDLIDKILYWSSKKKVSH